MGGEGDEKEEFRGKLKKEAGIRFHRTGKPCQGIFDHIPRQLEGLGGGGAKTKFAFLEGLHSCCCVGDGLEGGWTSVIAGTTDRRGGQLRPLEWRWGEPNLGGRIKTLKMSPPQTGGPSWHPDMTTAPHLCNVHILCTQLLC